PALSDTALVTINLNDINEAPVVDDQAFSVDEVSTNGASVGVVVAADPDAGQSLTYAITGGNESGVVSINPTTGEITVADETQLDSYTSPVYHLTAALTDNGVTKLPDTAVITLTVVDVNEAPDIADQTFSVPENSGNGTAVGTVAFVDPDAGQSHTFAITA